VIDAAFATVITRVYVPGVVIEDRSHFGLTPAVTVSSTQATGEPPLTVREAESGCTPVDGYGSANRNGDAIAGVAASRRIGSILMESPSDRLDGQIICDFPAGLLYLQIGKPIHQSVVPVVLRSIRSFHPSA
jgi:hypothetical protein